MTPVQKQILDFIVAFRAERGYSPTLQEIADWRGKSKVATFETVNALIRKGKLRRERGKYEARNLVPAGEVIPNVERIASAACIIESAMNRMAGRGMPELRDELRRAAGILMGA